MTTMKKTTARTANRRTLLLLRAMLGLLGGDLARGGGDGMPAVLKDTLTPAVDPGAEENESSEAGYGEDGDDDGECGHVGEFRSTLLLGGPAEGRKPKVVCAMHRGVAFGCGYCVLGGDAGLFGFDEAAGGFGDESPGVVMAGLGFGVAFGSPGEARVGDELGDAA